MDNTTVPTPQRGPGQAPGQPPEHKLNMEQKIEICKMLAHGFAARTIAGEIKKRYDIEINQKTVHGYGKSKRWRKHIAKFREIFAKNVMKIPGAQKQDRVEYLLAGINTAVEYGAIKSLASLIKELRIEMEGEKPLIDASQHTHYNFNLKKMSDEEIIDLARKSGAGIPNRIDAYVGKAGGGQ